jgi:hypothetical protein
VKLIDFGKPSKENDAEDLKQLEEWVEKFKKSNKSGFAAFFIKKDSNGDSIERIFAFKKNTGLEMIGALEFMKSQVEKVLNNED